MALGPQLLIVITVAIAAEIEHVEGIADRRHVRGIGIVIVNVRFGQMIAARALSLPRPPNRQLYWNLTRFGPNQFVVVPPSDL